MGGVEDEVSGTIIGEYILKNRVGAGNFAVVWKAQHRASGKNVAVKRVDLSKLNKNLRNCLNCELNFLASVNHPNIIRLFEVIEAEEYVFLVLEFCAGGHLASYIQRNGRVPEHIARKFLQQLGSGLEVLHTHHVIHRDLKPENILLSSPNSDAVLKITDFGLSRIVLPGDQAETVCGSPFYTAPEVLQFEKYDEKVDMWSVGAILFEILNGYPPFNGRNNVQLLRNIGKCNCLPFSQVVLASLHPDCVDMCRRLLRKNPADRLSFEEFSLHKFLRS